MDPWAELGLDGASATADDVRAARRRLARELHPDTVAGQGVAEVADATARLAQVNAAADRALAEVAGRPAGRRARRSASSPPSPPQPERAPMPAPGAESAVWAEAEGDEAVFSVPHLPVEAFELLYLAFSGIGDPKVVEEPYLLEGMVDDPFLGVASVELVPEAGGSIVTVRTRPFTRAGHPPPTPAQVAGRLLWELKGLEL